MFNKKGRGGRHGGSSYNQNAQRLREKLNERRQENNEEVSETKNESNDQNDFERHPPHLRGRDIGLWYARKNKDNPRNEEPRIIVRN
jgi:hypothetical protein